MIIKKVILKDFFRYYGLQEIDCSVKGDENVVVIIGENGRGKTTLLMAFNWVFYDEIDEPLKLGNILNHRKKRELGLGEETEVSVSVYFEEGNAEYKMTRTVIFKKNEKDKVELITKKSNVNIYEIEENGDETELNHKVFSQKLLIPKDLRGFFFFDGERINRLAKVDGKKEIKNAILNVLGISYFDNTKDHLSLTRKGFMETIKRYQRNLPNKSALVIDHTSRSKKVEDLEGEISKLNQNLKEDNNTLERLNSIIGNSNEAAIKEMENRNIKIEKSIDECSSKLEDLEKGIKKHIASDFKYYLMHKYTDDVERILETKRKEGILPSTVKDIFIDDLIKRGKCICGRCIEEGTEEYANVLRIKEQAGSRALDDAYYNLTNLICIIRKQKKDFYKKLNSLIDERNSLKAVIFEYNEELKVISEKLSNSDSNEIKNASITRDACKKNIEESTKRLGVLEKELSEHKSVLDTIDKKLRDAESVNSTVDKLKKKVEITDQIIKLNNEFREMFIEVVRSELDKRIKEVYEEITNKDYRVPVLTDKFELKVLSELNNYNNKYEADEEVLSTGEGQITSLSFIGALVSYAKDTRENMILSKLSGEEYPIVMDSPFGNLDETHTKNIASNIGKLASQVIIVVSNKQWEGYVKDNIKNNVIRSYRMIDGEDIYSTGEYTKIIKEES